METTEQFEVGQTVRVVAKDDLLDGYEGTVVEVGEGECRVTFPFLEQDGQESHIWYGTGELEPVQEGEL